MMERPGRFSATFDCDPDGTVDAVLNAGSARGFTVTALHLNWQPEDMTSSSDLPQVAVTRFTGTASGGTAGTIFSHVDGDAPATSMRIEPTAVGSSPVPGPQFWPGVSSYTAGVWYLHGGQYVADFEGSAVQVARNNSLLIHATKLITATVYLRENLVD